MVSSLSPRDQVFLNNINRIAERLDKAQRQIATGIGLAQVSDSPDQISTLLSARASLSAANQTQTNLGRVKAAVDVSEQALRSGVDLLDRVQTLAAQAATSTQTADGRASIGQEVGSILQQLVGLAATQVEGRYVFSGNSDQTAPYSIDPTQATPVSSYQGTAASSVAQHPNGTTFQIAHTAQEIFDSTDPTTNIFVALTNLQQALSSNDQTGVQASLDGFKAISSHLNTQLAFYGTTQNEVADATTFGSNLQLQLQTQIANIENADPTAAILELNQASIQQQAALSARARVPRTTLFDYLG
ncbi:MAG: flagellin [Acidobacteriota bacterium]